MSSFGIYLIGYIIFIIGLAVGADMLGVSGRWIVVGVLVLIGIGIAFGVPSTRRRDNPNIQ